MPSPDPIAPPEGAEHLLRAFWSLHRLRRGGVNGPDPIQPRDIADWCAVTGNHLRSEEIDLIFRMDATYLATVQTLTVNKSDASVSIAEGPSI